MPSTFRHPARFHLADPPPKRPSARRFWLGLVVLLAAFWFSGFVLFQAFWVGLGGLIGSTLAITALLWLWAGEEE